MTQYVYEQIKEVFHRSEHEFKEMYGKDLEIEKSVIETLANTEYDSVWPLNMLESIRPEFAQTLKLWTAHGFDDFRKTQNGSSRKLINEVKIFENNLHLLPRWNQEVHHFSKSNCWYELKPNTTYKLDSQMSCCKKGYTHAYALDYAVVLIFKKLESGRLIGSLSTENCEGEVLLPKGTKYKVTSIQKKRREITLEEIM